MTKNIEDAATPIRDSWEEIKNQFFQVSPGHYLILTTVYRSPQEQFDLFKKGRTMDSQGHWIVQDKDAIVTNVDGYKIVGAHNYMPSRAIDVAVVDNQTGKTIWQDSLYYPLLEIAKSVDLESGGSWTSIKDWPHIQIKNYKNYEGN